MRNTLFLFPTRDLAWMRPALCEQPLKPAERRFGQLGMPPAEVDRLMEVLRVRLAQGPLPRPEARELLLSEGVDPGDDNARIYWLFGAAAMRGVLVIRPALEREQTFVAGPEAKELPAREGARKARPPLPGRPRAGDGRRPRVLAQVVQGRRAARVGERRPDGRRSRPSAGR